MDAWQLDGFFFIEHSIISQWSLSLSLSLSLTWNWWSSRNLSTFWWNWWAEEMYQQYTHEVVQKGFFFFYYYRFFFFIIVFFLMCFLLGGNRIEVNSKQRIRMRIREQWNWWVIHIWFYWPTKAWAMIIWVSRACWVRRSHVEWISSQVVRWAYKYIYIFLDPNKSLCNKHWKCDWKAVVSGPQS